MSDDDDFAMAMFEMQDTAHTRRKQEETENTETWWIVLHSRVAVRPAPTTEGKPVCVLPQGAVVRAKTVRRVNGTRWVMISDDDVPRLVKKKKKAAAEGQEEAPPPAPGCCMMIESPTAGQLLMVAPKEFDWERVRAVPPRDRGEAARQSFLGAQAELTDEQISQLLEQADAHIARQQQQQQQGPQRAADSRGSQISFSEAADGLVDLSINEAPGPASQPVGVAALHNATFGAPAHARGPRPMAPLPEAKPMNKYDEIMARDAIVTRAERKQAEAVEEAKQAAEKAVARNREFAKQARMQSLADELGEAGPVDHGDHGRYGDFVGPAFNGDWKETAEWFARARGLTPGKGPAWHAS